MQQLSITRRVFLAAASAAGIGTLVGCGGSSGDAPPGGSDSPYVAYRLSTKGKRASNAAKANAANKLFATPAAAEAGRAHAGDPSRVVRVDLSEAAWMQYFGGGNAAVDMRNA